MVKEKKENQAVVSGLKVKLALACDQYVDGKDRIAGYVVYDEGLVGNLQTEDFNHLLKKGFLKVA